MAVPRIVPGLLRDSTGAFRSAPWGTEKNRSTVAPAVIVEFDAGFQVNCCSPFTIDPYAYLKLFCMPLKTFQYPDWGSSSWRLAVKVDVLVTSPIVLVRLAAPTTSVFRLKAASLKIALSGEYADAVG